MSGPSSFLRPDADLLGMLAGIHEETPDEGIWARDIVELYARTLARESVIGLKVVTHDDALVPQTSALYSRAEWVPGIAADAQWTLGLPPDLVRALFYPAMMVATHEEIIAAATRDVSMLLAARHRKDAIGNLLGIIVHPAPNVALVLWARQEQSIVVGRTERRLLARIGHHLEATYRARIRPGDVVAEVGNDGRIRARTDRAPDGLERHLDAVRRAGERDVVDPTALWSALVAGRFTLLRKRGGYRVVENPSAAHAIRALSARELEALRLVLRGSSVKMAAYALGLSRPVTSTLLHAAADKLGLFSSTELVRVAAMFLRDANEQLADRALSDAEREILVLLQRGLSNAEIARARSRSARTIANQVASLLRKTGSASRRILVARTAPSLRVD